MSNPAANLTEQSQPTSKPTAIRLQDLTHEEIVATLVNERDEWTVLGGVMLRPEFYWQIADTITREHFGYERHRVLWDIVSQTIIDRPLTNNEPLTYAYLAPLYKYEANLVLEKQGKALDDGQVNKIFSMIGNGASGLDHMNAAVKRLELAHLCVNAYGKTAQVLHTIQTLAKTRNMTAQEAGDKIQSLLADVGSYRITEDISPEATALRFMQRLEALVSGQIKVSASPTAFTEFDTLIGEGLRQSELSILAGSTGTGKTTLSTQWFMAAKNAMYITMEMSAFDLISQIAEQHTGVWRSKTTSGKITSDEYAGIITVLDLMTTQNNRVWECPKMSVHQLRIMLRQLKARNQLPELVIVDGLWLMDKAGAPSDKEYANYPDTVNKLVELATNFNIHILLIHQLKIERRGEVDVDTLSGGGSLAYGAQNVFFLGRESDFTTLKIRKNRSGRGTDNKAILSFDKNKGTYSLLRIERA